VGQPRKKSGQFWAKVNNPKGIYYAGESEIVDVFKQPWKREQKHAKVLDSLITKFLRGRWRLLPYGAYWYSHIF